MVSQSESRPPPQLANPGPGECFPFFKCRQWKRKREKNQLTKCWNSNRISIETLGHLPVSLKSPKFLNLRNLALSVMENIELWHFQNFLHLIIKYLRPPVWLNHPNDENENQSMFLSGVAYSIWMNYNRQVQHYYQSIMFILGMATVQHHLTGNDTLW